MALCLECKLLDQALPLLLKTTFMVGVDDPVSLVGWHSWEYLYSLKCFGIILGNISVRFLVLFHPACAVFWTFILSFYFKFFKNSMHCKKYSNLMMRAKIVSSCYIWVWNVCLLQSAVVATLETFSSKCMWAREQILLVSVLWCICVCNEKFLVCHDSLARGLILSPDILMKLRRKSANKNWVNILNRVSFLF